ncbi:formimidoylglutamate deiminase [Yangia mangrovi]|uniref:Formimidoylglutamate deiminase n=3 Tax=Alloyangia mangrovi TaxID=1779329 RepID=A0ABT2KL74_9RHOB|nr:formimidoylglutamate deiminase [Alloyangia mangrovi]MCT4371355.1 formimidoylglutamate deiminase [Alloyangia mangrovi]
MTSQVFAGQALLPEGWARDVVIGFDAAGTIARVETGAEQAPGMERVEIMVPALSNLHSHAFQRAMAGLAEVAGPSADSFWTWRDRMYRCVGSMTPDDIETVALYLQIELLKGGFGHLVEFHYQHHSGTGVPYANPAETSLRQFEAARQSGIGLTQLPVFYAQSDFGGLPPVAGQRPFLHDVDGYLRLMETVRARAAEDGQLAGCAIHSLRAATPEQMRAILAELPEEAPIHIHVAEQMREVEASIAWSGRRPVEWLLDEMPVDARWCLIHATHLTDSEVTRMAQSGAVAGLCPATEANLGDGIFEARDFLAQGGRFGVGTDSHVATSVAEELRLLEYSQRLRDRARNCLAAGEGSSTGRRLLGGALAGGHQAAGIAKAGLQVGAAASWLVMDHEHPFVGTASGDTLIDRWIFALGDQAIRDVIVRGKKVIENRRHALDEEIAPRFAEVLRKIQA